MVNYEYDAWGNILKAANADSGVPTDLYKLNPRLYGGYWYDYDLGLYFMKTRMYHSELGRFLSKDQLTSNSSALALNPYLYCGNNPIDRIDPSGKGWWSAITQFASNVVQTIKRAVTTVVFGTCGC